MRLRSPTAIMEALGGGQERPRNWRQLFGDATAKDLAEAATKHAERMRDAFCSWNARWMRQLDTTKADLKRLTIQRKLLQGYVVAIQETHWDAEQRAAWSSAFPGSSVVTSLARGPQGGVAVLLPLGCREEGRAELVQGCALRVVVDKGGHRFAVTSLYLPPADRRPTLQRFVEALANVPNDADEEWFMGDLNFNPHTPGDGEDDDLAGILREAIGRRGSAVLGQDGFTHKGSRGKSTIDFIAGPAHRIGSPVNRFWYDDISDHAMLQVVGASPMGGTLPAPAWGCKSSLRKPSMTSEGALRGSNRACRFLSYMWKRRPMGFRRGHSERARFPRTMGRTARPGRKTAARAQSGTRRSLKLDGSSWTT